MNKELEAVKKKAAELESQMSDPGVISDSRKMKQLAREYAAIKDAIDISIELGSIKAHINEAEAEVKTSKDPEMVAMAEEELGALRAKETKLTAELEEALIPPDPLDSRNTIIEIRAGAGGDESALFAAELFRMYARFAERKGWKTALISANRNDIGG